MLDLNLPPLPRPGQVWLIDGTQFLVLHIRWDDRPTIYLEHYGADRTLLDTGWTALSEFRARCCGDQVKIVSGDHAGWQYPTVDEAQRPVAEASSTMEIPEELVSELRGL